MYSVARAPTRSFYFWTLTNMVCSYLRELESRHGLSSPPGRRADATTPAGHTERRPSLPASDIAASAPSPQPVPQPQDDEAPEPAAEPASSVIEPGFRQNPLADNDYTFAAAAGRYCEYPGPSLT